MRDFRDDVLTEMTGAMWDALIAQVDMGYVDRDSGVIDVGHADSVKMEKLAEAALRVVEARTSGHVYIDH
jgi:hypothetical protein